MPNKIDPIELFDSTFKQLEHEAKAIKLIQDVMFRAIKLTPNVMFKPPTEPDPMELAKAQKEDQALFELEDQKND